MGPFVWGALLGAGVALLLAPRSGQETQEEIRRTATRLRTGVEDRVTYARDSVTGAVTRFKQMLENAPEHMPRVMPMSVRLLSSARRRA